VVVKYLPMLALLVLVPLFSAAILLNAPGPEFKAAITVLAPAVFYCGYTMVAVKRATQAAERRQAKFEHYVRVRLDEFDPQEARLSRDYFELKLTQEIKRSKRHGLPLCVLTLTLPSQTSGKGVFAADLVRITAGALRAEDSFGRLGRDQYVISLPHTTPAGAAAVIERLTKRLEEHEPHFGIAYLPPGRYSAPERLIEFALATPVEPEELIA
jgi:hypothetical protein